MVAIMDEASLAARRAADEYVTVELSGRDCMPCGFAWVELYGVKGNTKLGRLLKQLEFHRWAWNPAKASYQNMHALFAGAKAAAAVLTKYGFEAYPTGRYD
jgi:hypothetical protein